MAARRSQLLESPTRFVAPTGGVFGVNMDEAYYILKQKTVSQLFHFKRESVAQLAKMLTHILEQLVGEGRSLKLSMVSVDRKLNQVGITVHQELIKEAMELVPCVLRYEDESFYLPNKPV